MNKFVAVFNWSKSQFEKEQALALETNQKCVQLMEIVEGFLDYIQFHKIPIQYLMNEVRWYIFRPEWGEGGKHQICQF